MSDSGLPLRPSSGSTASHSASTSGAAQHRGGNPGPGSTPVSSSDSYHQTVTVRGQQGQQWGKGGEGTSPTSTLLYLSPLSSPEAVDEEGGGGERTLLPRIVEPSKCTRVSPPE